MRYLGHLVALECFWVVWLPHEYKLGSIESFMSRWMQVVALFVNPNFYPLIFDEPLEVER